MVDTATNSFSFPVMTTGSDSGAWGDNITNKLINPLDDILGGTQPITMSPTGDTPLSLTQWKHKAFVLTGTLLANVTLTLPLSINASGGLPSVSGEFIVVNNCTGNFSVTVKSSVASTSSVTVPQAAVALLWCDVSGFVFYASGANGIPFGAVMDFAGPNAPAGWLLCFGGSFLRAQFPGLFNTIGTTYGAADGAHFNVPDYRGQVIAGLDNMGGSAANRVTSAGCGINGAALGAAGGDQLLQSHSHANSLNDPGHLHGLSPAPLAGPFVGSNAGPWANGGTNQPVSQTQTATTGISISNAAAGSGGSQNMQPTRMANKIIFCGA
jgi:microcystin-dependent protein